MVTQTGALFSECSCSFRRHTVTVISPALLLVPPLQTLHNRLANGSLPAPTKLATAASAMSPVVKHMIAVHPCAACSNSWLPMIGPTVRYRVDRVGSAHALAEAEDGDPPAVEILYAKLKAPNTWASRCREPCQRSLLTERGCHLQPNPGTSRAAAARSAVRGGSTPKRKNTVGTE